MVIMPNERDEVMRLLARAEAEMMRREEGLAKAIQKEYEQARRDLLNTLGDAYAALGGNPSPEDIRRLSNQAGLIRAIERRMEQLGIDVQALIREGLTDAVNAAAEAVLAELEVLAAGAGVPFYPFAIDGLLELTVIPAVEQIPGLVGTVATQLTSELRVGLAAGERFSELAGRLYSATLKNGQASIFRRGMTSAELMARRAVIQANNNSRILFMERAKTLFLPTMKKQAVAAVQSRTTKTCLRVHGQIKEIDEPFELTAEPRFARKMMQPPFHWNCRTSVVAYLEEYESDADNSTQSMRKAAQKELASR